MLRVTPKVLTFLGQKYTPWDVSRQHLALALQITPQFPPYKAENLASLFWFAVPICGRSFEGLLKQSRQLMHQLKAELDFHHMIWLV